jgi:hypothetical protein
LPVFKSFIMPFTAGNTARNGKTNPPSPFKQARRLQQIAMRDCEDPKVKPHIRAALMRAWCDLEERVRVLKMKPLPKPVDVTKLAEQRRAARAARAPHEPAMIEAPTPPPATT